MSSLYLNTSFTVPIHLRFTRPPTTTTITATTTNNKPLLVFIHYWGGSSSTWYKLTSFDSPASLSNEYPTVAVDLRGWGDSVPPPSSSSSSSSSSSTAIEPPSNDNSNSYSITSMATDIASILTQLHHNSNNNDDDDEEEEEEEEEEKTPPLLTTNGFILIGHSMGAKVALATLPLLPKPLRYLLRGLVLLAPPPPTPLELPAAQKAQQQRAYESSDSVRWTVENVLANKDNLDEERDVALVVRDSLRGAGAAKEAWPLFGMQEDISGSLRRGMGGGGDVDVDVDVDVGGRGGKGKVRVRLIVGGLDVIEPRERVERDVGGFLETVCGCEVLVRVVEDVRHLIPLECPGVVREEVVSLAC